MPLKQSPSTRDHLCRFVDHRLAILVYQGSDPKQPYPTLVIRQSATLPHGLSPGGPFDVVRSLVRMSAT